MIELKTVKPETLYFYAHNGGNFDTKIVLNALYNIHSKLSVEMPIQISDETHRVYQLDVITRAGSVSFRDSLKIIQGRVSRIALKTLGITGEEGKLSINFAEIARAIAAGTIECSNNKLETSLEMVELHKYDVKLPRLR